MNNHHFSSGLEGLDRLLKGIIAGDNVVWEVDDIANYASFVPPYVKAANKSGKPLIYIRFASHLPLISESSEGVHIHTFDPSEGFETFTDNIHQTIRKTGRGAYYLFDSLSELSSTWLSDQMLGNFFRLTCPYLFDLETLAYFCICRNFHSSEAIRPIQETTQLFLDLYEHNSILYLRPLKVQHRYSATMNMFHAWKNNTFEVVTDSSIISEILTSAKWSGLQRDAGPGFWEREFVCARTAATGAATSDEKAACFNKLISMVFSRDEHILELARKYLSLEDILDVRRRMIGTGLIGGKAVGMLLARAILKKDNPRFKKLLEEHDSFFIGSDVFYDYLVANGVWWIRQSLRRPDNFLEEATRARRLVITGKFSEDKLSQFVEMLNYFGQSPFIVRSSSLLEDNFGNAFAGKYDSVFCANQGPLDRRVQDFLAAVRTIYASAMSEKALRYRHERGMLEHDEQMALLVMRVSGKMYNNNFYPPVAGVGFSFNPYVWDREIDPNAGVIRLVFGLGTRAVDRSDDDYTRIVALNAPLKRPEHNFDQVRQYTQCRADYIDLAANQLVSGYCTDLFKESGDLPLEYITDRDTSSREMRMKTSRYLSFNNLIKKSDFIDDMRTMLDVLTKAYDYPVDIEFTVNFPEENRYKVNLVQCRPLQVQQQVNVEIPKVEITDENRIIESRSAVVGQSRMVNIQKFIYIVPEKYGTLSIQDRYAIARLIGDINREMAVEEGENIMLLGPGRWGTSSPSLGIPVNFSDINRIPIIGEIISMHNNLIPDVSLGTHFLNELVEMEMLYLALYPNQKGDIINIGFFEHSPNRLTEILPGEERWNDVVRVIYSEDIMKGSTIVSLIADSLEQRVICYFKRNGDDN
jgi:pyruvate, water dikinase